MRHKMSTDNIVFIFQEVPQWADVDGREFAGRRYKIVSFEDSECAFALPSALAQKLLHAKAGRDWAACSTETLIILSMHLLPWDMERFSSCLSEASQYIDDHNPNGNKNLFEVESSL